MAEYEIISKIKDKLPKDSNITDFCFEGANVVVYTRNKDFLLNNSEIIKKLVNEIKKRVEVRGESDILLNTEDAKDIIQNLIPKEANLGDIWFDEKRGIVIIEAERPGMVIGKYGSILQSIKEKTFWIPKIRRSPAIKSDVIKTIRLWLYQNSDYRRRFLNKIGQKIYQKWERDDKYWIRVSCLGGFREVGRSCLLLQTPKSNVLLDCGVNVANPNQAYPILEAPEFDIKKLDAVIVSHAHTDHSAFIPWLYKYGFRGPTYCTEPTRDIMTMMQLDYIDVSQKDAKQMIYSSRDIAEMVKHTVSLDYNEVDDVTPDVRLTFHTAGHILGGSLVHLNIGNGYHNLLYTGDFKYGVSGLLEQARPVFQRLETLFIESTYGGRESIQPGRKESEEELIRVVNETLSRGGKVLIPAFGVGRGQEVMLILEKAVREKKINTDIFIDGMIWHITAITTAYPEFLSSEVQKSIIQKGYNPFLNPCFKRVGSAKERTELVEHGKPCVIIATSGMLTGGASVDYFKNMAEDHRNSIIFAGYLGEGSLGRKIQRGDKKVPVEGLKKTEVVQVRLQIHTIEGFSGHSDRNALINFMKDIVPKPRRVIVGHGESSRCLDLASSIHKMFNVETNAPRLLDALRIK